MQDPVIENAHKENGVVYVTLRDNPPSITRSEVRAERCDSNFDRVELVLCVDLPSSAKASEITLRIAPWAKSEVAPSVDVVAKLL